MTQTLSEWRGDTLILRISVVPRAAREEVIGEHNGRLKIRVSAPPVAGAANARLIGFLAKAFRLPKSAIGVCAGENSRHKCISVKCPRVLPDWLTLGGEAARDA